MDDGISESVYRQFLSVLFCELSYIESKYTEGQNTEDVGIERRKRRAGPKCVRYVLQSQNGYLKIFANPALLAFSTTCWRFFRLCCANVHFFLLLAALSSSTSSSTSTRLCPSTAVYSSSSSASPAERCNGEPNLGLGARRGRSSGSW